MSRPSSHLAVAAAAGAVVTSGIALTAAVVSGVTHESVLDLAPDWVEPASSGVHGLTFALLAAVLVRFGTQVDGTSRARRWTRRLLAALMAFMAVPQLAGAVVPLDTAPEPVGIAVTIAFVLAFPVAGALGLMLLRRSGVRAAALVLASVLAAMAVLIAVGFLVPDWAHPAYVEAPLYLGIALLGLQLDAAPAARPHARPAERGQTIPA